MFKQNYWIVAGDKTQVYHSERSKYVPINDPEFLSWGKNPAKISNFDELTEVLVNYPNPAKRAANNIDDIILKTCASLNYTSASEVLGALTIPRYKTQATQLASWIAVLWDIQDQILSGSLPVNTDIPTYIADITLSVS